MQLFPSKAPMIATALTLVLSVACGDSTSPDEGETQDFSGNYTLHEISSGTVGGSLTVLAGSTGTFNMTATTYEVLIDVSNGLQTIDDHGTYTATGTATAGNFTQQSSVDPALQYQGTYAWNASTNRLTIDTSSQGVRTVLVLQRN